jgi:hypothetical protein
MPTTSAKERRYPAVGVEAGTTGSGEDGDDGGPDDDELDGGGNWRRRRCVTVLVYFEGTQ